MYEVAGSIPGQMTQTTKIKLKWKRNLLTWTKK